MRIFSLSFLILIGMTLWGCGDKQSPEKTDKSTNKNQTEPVTTGQKPPEVDNKTTKSKKKSAAAPEVVSTEPTIKAKFIEFSLGDASHFIFEDETGKKWDFAGSKEKTIKFARELPTNQANEDNQGWGSNADLQGKWFTITYTQSQQELYIDGPIGTVYTINKAEPIK